MIGKGFAVASTLLTVLLSVLLTVASLLLSRAAQAQAITESENTGMLPRSAEVSLGISYRTWSVKPDEGEDFSLGQFVLPAYVTTRIREDLEFSYLFNFASSGLDLGPAEESQLSGVTDGKLGLTYTFSDRRFSAGLGLRIPTGQSRLDPDEETIARQLAERIFGFRVKRYGEGTDFETRGGYATLLDGGTTVSAGASYLIKGNFPVLSPIDQEESTYQPGNEVSLLAAASGRAYEREWAGRAQLTFFGTDQRDGTDEIDEGAETSIRLRVREEHLIGIIDWEADGLWKGETKVVSAGGLPPSRDVGGSILRLGGRIFGRMDHSIEVGGRAGMSWYGETERGVGDGLIFEAGTMLRRTLHPSLDLNAGYTLFFGNAEDGTVDLVGHDIIVSFGLGLRPDEAPGARREIR